MRNSGPRYVNAFVLVSSFLAMMIIFVSCEQSKPTAPPSPAVSQVTPSEKVFVVFEGPWAFAPDPKDPNSVIALAPKNKGHRDLLVKASNQSYLAAGVYDLSVPSHSGQSAATADPSIVQAKIDSPSLQHAIYSKSVRYVVRVPKPEEYVVAARAKSRVGATYPPDPSSEKDYATAVSLRYNVSSLNGFSLAGTLDSGSFNPLLLQVETPTIRFMIEPAQDDDPADKCSTHSREGFRDLTSLLGLTLYVDFPNDAANCHSKDPQTVRPKKARLTSSMLERIVTFFSGNFVERRAADAGTGINPRAMLLFFFGRPQGDCESPDIILTPTS